MSKILKIYDNVNSRYMKSGKFDWLDSILPDTINFSNPRYFEMDTFFYSGLIIVNYPKEQRVNWISPLISLDFNVDISIFYEKLDSSKVIREITYHIGDMNGALKTVSQNQQDIDIIRSSYEDAKYIRNQMQVNKEDLYHLCIYCLVYEKDMEKLKVNIERLEAICASMGLQTRKAIFRQEQIFNSMLPVCDNNKDIKESATRNVLTEALTSTYPFVSTELYDAEGILIGENLQSKSLIIIDRFDSEKYKNANMCVLGTSGAGKSFFVKLMILRNRYMGIKQFVVDPDGEYSKVCNAIGGLYINVNSMSELSINIMDIRESISLENESYLSNKLKRLGAFFSLLFGEITNEETVFLEEKIIKCYSKFGITFDDSTLFEECEKINVKKRFKSSDKMPILQDLYYELDNDEKTKRLAILLKPCVFGSLSFLNRHTNVNFDNKLIVADIHQLEEKYIPICMYVIIDVFWDKICENRAEKKVIYMDEIWRLIGSTGNLYTAEFVYKIFKTIRKFGGGATAITQDVADFFDFEDGKYGRAIINNSALKFILQVEEEDSKVLKDVVNLSFEEENKIKTFQRGNGLLIAGKNHIVVKVEANNEEYKLITTDRKDM